MSIDEKDKKVMRYAGFLGHRFVGVCDDTGVHSPRRTFCEANTKESCLGKFSVGLANVTVYERDGKTWKKVHLHHGTKQA